jgi:polyferredoxin
MTALKLIPVILSFLLLGANFFRAGQFGLVARYSKATETARASAAAFTVTAAMLSIVQIKVPFSALLPERLFPGTGWVLVFVLSLYAAWLTEKMLDPQKQARWRGRIWSLFSIVFFAQLLLGLAGLEQFLMTGELHFPIPALILAGPAFRGDGLFMPILFGATLLLVGPAWCSHLCYIGAWDNACAAKTKKPNALPAWAKWARIGIASAVIISALLLRLAGASVLLAGSLALAFGLAGVAVMLLFSRRAGTMVHCTVFCPIGLIANIAGKLSPFRIRIGNSCTKCGSCSKACRYNALSEADIERKRPALTCSLCGDCVGSCKDGQINYRFLWLRPQTARVLFIVLAVSLHASFLGLARI